MQDVKWKKQYIMFDLIKLNSDIWYWENTISYPEELLNLINKIDFENNLNIPKWKIWNASDNVNLIYGATKMIKSDLIKTSIKDIKLYQNSLYIINSLKMAAEMCYERYMDGHNLDKSKYILDLSHVPVKRWDVGSSMGPHSDSSFLFPNLSFTSITYLNENYEGGELNFP
jgi:hypothetical protein